MGGARGQPSLGPSEGHWLGHLASMGLSFLKCDWRNGAVIGLLLGPLRQCVLAHPQGTSLVCVCLVGPSLLVTPAMPTLCVLWGSSPPPSPGLSWTVSPHTFLLALQALGVEDEASSAGLLRSEWQLRWARSKGRGGFRGFAGLKLSSRTHRGKVGWGRGRKPELVWGCRGGGTVGHLVAHLEACSSWTPSSLSPPTSKPSVSLACRTLRTF